MSLLLPGCFSPTTRPWLATPRAVRGQQPTACWGPAGMSESSYRPVIMSYCHNVIMTSCRQVVMSSILYIVWQSVSFLPLGETIDCDVTPSHSLGSEENLLHSTSTAAAFSAETLWRSWGLSIVPCNNQSWARDYVTIFNCNSERVLFNCLYITLMF